MPERSTHWQQLVALDAPMAKQFWVGFGAVGPRRRSSLIPSLFNVEGSETATEKSFGAGSLSSEGWNFEDTGRVQYDEHEKGFEKTYTHVEFAKGVVVERKLIDDNNTRIAFGDSRDLGDSAFRKREKSAASVFNNAFTSTTNDDGFSTLGADGKTLCADDHPRSAQDSTAFDNAGTSALSKSAVGSTRVAMSKFTDSTGDIMDVAADTILVPPDLEDTGLEITKSLLDPTSGNNAVNPQSGRYNLVVWHYLTDTNNWFMLESFRAAQFLNWFNRIPLEFGAEGDFDTFQRKYRAYMRYSYGWDDPRFIYGHNVT